MLASYVVGNTKTLTLDLRSGVAGGLESSRIIYRSSTLGSLHGFDYNIQPWAWDYLRQHRELLLTEPESDEPNGG